MIRKEMKSGPNEGKTRTAVDFTGGFKPESERTLREFKMNKQDETFVKIIGMFREYIGPRVPWSTSYNSIGAEALSMLKAARIEASSKDITNFSVALAEFQGEKDFAGKAGVFLDALMKFSPDKEFRIITKHLVKPPNLLGYFNTKSIAIEGDAGDSLGMTMMDGRISVTGSVHGSIGPHMQGGSIDVAGDVIDVQGLKGGTISIGGRYVAVHNPAGGTIVHRGKRILDLHDGSGRMEDRSEKEEEIGTVLIIDTERDVARTISSTIRLRKKNADNLEIFETIDHQNAVMLMTAYRFDVVIIDSQYRLDLVRFARECNPGCLIIGASGSEKSKKDFLSRGADVFMEKPHDFVEMVRLIDRAVAKKRGKA